MTKKELLELIRDTIKEYKGHHTMKNASPRPFTGDKDELEKWWNCRETQEARKKFVSLYVNKQDNSLETLVKCLSIA